MLVDGPPRKVIDACAGAGGKTLQVAAQMKNRGELFALDVDARRLEDLKLRARRAGVHNVRIHAIAPEGEAALASIAQWKDGAERVLVDAPCSGTGTFRRKPDARYRLDEALLADHVRRQDELIERFSTLVKPGGRLIYGTCSMLKEENEDVVARFLGKHAEFTVLPPEKWLGEAGPNVTRGGFLRLFPHTHGTDGFFGAVLERRK
jgi:16S rRNA (cytosine967-C5)-methyltransferase